MASTTLFLKGSKELSSIYVRFTEKKVIDLKVSTGLYVKPQYWDKRNKKIRNVIDVPNRDEINSKLAKLQIAIIDQYNLDYINGAQITSKWLNELIKRFFNRPQEEIKKSTPSHALYLSDFANWWLKEKAPKHKVTANRYMDEKTIGQYQQAINNIEAYEAKKGKIRLDKITAEVMDDFSNFLSDSEGYAEITAKRKISRIKFFCERAEGEGFEVHKGYKERVFVKEEKEEYKHPYLNPDEINAIYKLDLSHDSVLDKTRDNLIIGVWTGLRVSDFLTSLNISNINGDFIRIKTKKTRHDVAIPLHPMVKEVLKKHNGLPPKMPEQKFNDKIKIVGMLADIDEVITGAVVKVDEKTKIKRKSVGLYKKHELITSHICRRSFATNLFNKVPNKVIMDIAGWKNEDMLLKYIKATKMESAMVLKNLWEKQYNV